MIKLIRFLHPYMSLLIVWQGKLSSPTSVDLARVSKYPGCYWEILINFWKIEISRERPIHCWNSRSLWEVIKSCSFLDMGFSDPAYTWSSSRARIAYIKERLDHAWCNELWRLQFSEAGPGG